MQGHMTQTPISTGPRSTRRDFLRHSSLVALGLSAGCLPRPDLVVVGDTLHIRTYNDVTSLDPAQMLSGSDWLIGNAIQLN